MLPVTIVSELLQNHYINNAFGDADFNPLQNASRCLHAPVRC